TLRKRRGVQPAERQRTEPERTHDFRNWLGFIFCVPAFSEGQFCPRIQLPPYAGRNLFQSGQEARHQDKKTAFFQPKGSPGSAGKKPRKQNSYGFAGGRFSSDLFSGRV